MVYLIGAGPGDNGLLTIKGKEIIKKADVIVYDYLADKNLLDYARKDAEFIYVGKKADNHTMKQEDINNLLVKLAKEGKIVARLKGGDPFVFGRGGEEALALRKENLEFEIVSGVTSAIAAAAYAGIPVTHRHIASSFAVITGHEDPKREKSGINWEKLSTGIDTLVFLMGVKNLKDITENLIKNGRSGKTPAALVRWGTKNEQDVLVTTLSKAVIDVEKNNFKPPAIFIVGEVVKLREKLQWFDNKPLFGKTILVTRARHQASKLTGLLENLGARCVQAPVIKIDEPDDNYKSLDDSINHIRSYDWIIFTSVNGVEKFFTRLWQKKLDTRALFNAKIGAIGSETAKCLKNYGIKADIVPKEYKAEGLIDSLSPLIKDKHILIPRAKEARNVLPNELIKAGAIVDIVQCYKTSLVDEDYTEIKEMIKNGKIDMVTFTSSSTVTNFLKIIDKDLLPTSLTLAAIGPITLSTCEKNGLKVKVVADVYTLNGLTKVIKEYFTKKEN